MSYVNDLLKQLQRHRDTDCVDIKEDIDDLIDMAENAKDEYDDDIKNLEERNASILSELADAESENELTDEIRTDRSPDGICLKADNLLDQQIIEAFAGCLSNPKVNHLQFLQVLQGIEQHGITTIDKVETAY